MVEGIGFYKDFLDSNAVDPYILLGEKMDEIKKYGNPNPVLEQENFSPSGFHPAIVQKVLINGKNATSLDGRDFLIIKVWDGTPLTLEYPKNSGVEIEEGDTIIYENRFHPGMGWYFKSIVQVIKKSKSNDFIDYYKMPQKETSLGGKVKDIGIG